MGGQLPYAQVEECCIGCGCFLKSMGLAVLIPSPLIILQDDGRLLRELIHNCHEGNFVKLMLGLDSGAQSSLSVQILFL